MADGKVNKADFVGMIAAESGLSKKQSELAVNAVVDSIVKILQGGDKLVIVGFGTFEVRARAEREGQNPQTKEKIKIPASKAPVFKAGKALKDAVNTGSASTKKKKK